MDKLPILYTAKGCSFCDKVKTFLRSHDIAFEERNVDARPEYLREAEELGNRWLPILKVGDAVMVDPTEEQLTRLVRS